MIRLTTAFLFITLSVNAIAYDLDNRLRQIIDIYKLEPLECNIDHDKDLADIGEIFFNTDSLSGEGDIGCHTCHLEEKSFTDGLPVSIGVGGSGKLADRVASNGILVPRNSFTLKGRGQKNFNAFFWDGKSEQSSGHNFTSPFGFANEKYDSLLAVAASLPIIARDEFLGVEGLYENSMLKNVDDAYFEDKFREVSAILNNKIFTSPEKDLKEAKVKFQQLGFIEVTLADIGNALAAFIQRDFSCVSTQWNDYLHGDLEALTEEQKEGAIIFYSEAKCAACHSGSLLSDFKYHSIAAPQGSVGVSALSQDLGRANVTYNDADRFKFRTPPLLFVSHTEPYGHAGQFSTLSEVLLHHVNPVAFLQNYKWTSDKEMIQYGKILGSRSNFFKYVDLNNNNELHKIEQYLNAL